MRKLILSLFVFFIVNAAVWGQNNLHEKRIYLFDVTKSMIGQGVVETPNIFHQVRQSLIDAIDEIEDPYTEIVVIPFTNKPHSAIQGFVSQKDSLKREISKIEVKSGDTNVNDAWLAGVSLLDTTKVNYMFLLTDGLHNCGPTKEELYKTLSNWNSIRKDRYFFSFYVMLTDNAVEQNIRNITKSTPQMWSIETLNIKVALIRTSLSQYSNIFEDKTVKIRFVSNNSKVFLEDLNVRFSFQDNPYYEIENTRKDSIDPSIYEFDVVEKLERMSIPVKTDVSLIISFNNKRYPLVFFTPEEINFSVVNRGVRKMSFKPVLW